MSYYDFEKLNEIPLQDICSNYGIKLRETATGFIGKVRDESTASFSISKSKGVWSDFGMAESGKTAISLMQYLEGGIDYKEASEKLAIMFNIEPEKGEKKEVVGLTNSQYKELGIVPERGTMNFSIDLSKISIQQAEKVEKRYGKPMVIILSENPKFHDSILINKVIPKIRTETEIYIKYKELYFQKFECSKNINVIEKDLELILYGLLMKKYGEEVNRLVYLLEKGLSKKRELDYLKIEVEEVFFDKIT